MKTPRCDRCDSERVVPHCDVKGCWMFRCLDCPPFGDVRNGRTPSELDEAVTP